MDTVTSNPLEGVVTNVCSSGLGKRTHDSSESFLELSNKKHQVSQEDGTVINKLVEVGHQPCQAQ